MAQTGCWKVGVGVLVVLNVLLEIAGLALLVIGSLLLASNSVFSQGTVTDPASVFMTFGLHFGTFLALSSGIILSITSVAGIAGASSGRPAFYCAYIGFLVVLIVAELILGVFTIVEREKVMKSWRVDAECYLWDYSLKKCNATGRPLPPNFKIDLARFEVELGCCGVYSYQDYWKENVITGNKQAVPWSCCERRSGDGYNFRSLAVMVNKTDFYKHFTNMDSCQRMRTVNMPKTINDQGCQRRFLTWIEMYFVLTISVTFALVIIQLSMIYLSAYLCKKSWKPR